MSSYLNKSKVRVAIALAMIAFVVFIADFIKHNAIVVDIIPKIVSIKEISASIGAQDFIGDVKDYEKKIKMQIIVKPRPIVKSKQIGYITKVYEEGGKRYLRFDNVKFLTGNAAIEAAKKDGVAGYENGEYFVYDDYYIVNSSKEIKSYVIADNSSLNLLGCWVDSFSSDINNQSASYDNFKEISSKYENMLCYIYTENDVVVKVEGQYTP